MAVTAVTSLVVFGVACTKEASKPVFELPSNFPTPTYDFSANPVTEAGFQLGRKLFYDPIFSRDSTVSCGSCHIQTSAFTHHGHDVSHGIDDRLGDRNSPPIMNLAWSKFFFWDGGVFNLDLQPIAPIENPVEMDEKMSNVLTKLRRSKHYPAQFKQVFGSDQITTALVLKALSQFMVSCVSANSKYDKVVRKEGAVFSEQEAAGFELFKAKCATCHSSELFTDNKFHNNGLTPSLRSDSGRYRITLNEADWYAFKTPSLRNIMKTAPYMHDGRFITIDAVLEHYSAGVKDMPTLDPLLKSGSTIGIALNATEKEALKAFLNTLTDESFLKDSRLSEQ